MLLDTSSKVRELREIQEKINSAMKLEVLCTSLLLLLGFFLLFLLLFLLGYHTMNVVTEVDGDNKFLKQKQTSFPQ